MIFNYATMPHCMKVVCIKNAEYPPTIIGEIYNCEIFDFLNSDGTDDPANYFITREEYPVSYRVRFPENVFKEHFVSLSEYREIKINKILK